MLSRAFVALAALQLLDTALRTHVHGFVPSSLPVQVAQRASSSACSVNSRCVNAA